jgi:cGMP-dependent protein kinase
MNLQDDSIEINDLYFIKHLGSGKFGSVSLVHNNTFFYAIKCLLKQNANNNKRFAEYLINERKIMFNLDHPFIIKISKTFKNDFCVFLLLEFVNGISLNSLKNRIKNIFDILFYIASVLLAIDYIHKKRIIHRDIKPNNIMISKNGYVKLIDFGTSKFVDDYTCSLLGTPHYIAPEILAGKGYSFSCDFWSIGIMCYEIYYKKFPFGNNAKDAIDVYNDVIYGKFKFESDFDEDESDFKELIKVLLEKEPEKRFCSLKKIKKLKIFEDFDWNGLLNKEIKAPFLPEIVNLSNINFNDFNVNYEDLILSEINNENIENNNCYYNNCCYNENSNWDEEF